jgi:hypothetical protein
MRRRTRSGGAGRVARMLGAVTLLLAAVSPPATARKEYHAETYRVTLRVQPDGSISVREEIRVRFDGGPFTFFYRGIPFTRTDGIDRISASDSTRVRAHKNRVEVTWNFAPCRDTTRTFVVDYRAQGVLYDEGDHRRLRWVAFPAGERPYRIDAGSADVVFPAGAPPPSACTTKPANLAFHQKRLAAEASVGQTSSWMNDAVLELEPTRLRANRTVVLQVDIPRGALTGSQPAWWLERLRRKERLPGVLAVAGALVLLGLLWVLRTRSDRVAKLAPGSLGARLGGSGPPVPEPPEEISPALSGTLLFGRPAMPQAFAVLFDLARRGTLRLDPGGSRSRWASPQPKIRRGKSAADLEPWERIVLDAIFERPNTDGSVEWRRAVSGLVRRYREFARSVQEGMVQRGSFDPAGIEGRAAMKRGLLILLVPGAAAAVAGFLLLDTLGPAAFIPVGAIAVVVFASAIATKTIPLRTRRGAELARAWNGFAHHLKSASKSSTPVDAARFAAWLPHAVALGVATPWVKAARHWGIAPPSWFRSDSGDIAGDMRVLTSVIAATSTSGGVAGGGNGAAGGGSSGAG